MFRGNVSVKDMHMAMLLAEVSLTENKTKQKGRKERGASLECVFRK